MPFADAAFISLAELAAPEHHRAYNEWHHLDHLPENLALPGVRWGQRWVRTPACRDASLVSDDPFSTFEYLTLYWFRPPVVESIAAWSDLADRSFQWGRRQELAWTIRPYMGFLRPILGYAAPRVDVSPQVLPLRPNRGAYVVATEVTDDAADRAAVERRNRWYDREGLPALIARDGVAGGWTFNGDETLAPAVWAQREQRRGAPEGGATSLRLTVLFLDGDPHEVASTIGLDDVLAADADGRESVRFAGPLETIEAWSYDWFDATLPFEARTQDP